MRWHKYSCLHVLLLNGELGHKIELSSSFIGSYRASIQWVQSNSDEVTKDLQSQRWRNWQCAIATWETLSLRMDRLSMNLKWILIVEVISCINLYMYNTCIHKFFISLYSNLIDLYQLYSTITTLVQYILYNILHIKIL